MSLYQVTLMAAAVTVLPITAALTKLIRLRRRAPAIATNHQWAGLFVMLLSLSLAIASLNLSLWLQPAAFTRAPIPFAAGAALLLLAAGLATILAGLLTKATASANLAELKEREIEHRYKTLRENSLLLTYATNKAGFLTFISPQVQRYGYKPEEIIGKNMASFVHPEDRKKVLKDFMQIISGKETASIQELRIKMPGSQGYTWVNAAKTAYRDENGKLISVLGEMQDINEQKLAQIELDRTRLRYQQLIEGSADITFQTNHEGDLTFASNQVRRYGYEPDDLVGKPYLDLVHADDRDRVAQEAARLTRGEAERVSLDYRTVGPDGQATWFESVIVVQRNEKGQPDGAIGQQRDVTERRQAEKRAHEAADKYERLFESSSDCIMIFDGPKHQDCNTAAIHLFGAANKQDLLGLSLTDLAPETQPDGQPTSELIQDKLAKAQESGRAFFECLANRLDGQELYTSIVLTTVQLDGRPMIQATIRDRTEQYGAELARQAEESKFRSFFDEQPSYCYIVSAKDGVILDVNRSALQALGYRKDELVGRPVFDLYHPDCQKRAKLLSARAKAGESLDNERMVVTTNDDQARVVLLSVNSVRGPGGEIDALIGVQRDITDEESIRAQVNELNELKSKFITTLSHITRTPLNRIRWALEAILDGALGDVAEEQRRMLHQALGSETAILRAIDNMNTTLDIERDQIELVVRPTSIDSLLKSVREEFESRPEIAGVSWSLPAADPTVPATSLDPDRIRLVISSLCDNAIRYSQGPANVNVTVALRPSGLIRVTVADQGIGVPQAEQGFVATRFFRGSNAQLAYPDGMGLGLYTAKALIEKHGGTFGFDSQEGQGSRFWFEVPAK